MHFCPTGWGGMGDSHRHRQPNVRGEGHDHLAQILDWSVVCIRNRRLLSCITSSGVLAKRPPDSITRTVSRGEGWNMANEDHVKRAGYAIGVWNRWRDENPDVSPDLSGADLSAGLYRKGKLFSANLKGTDFRRSNMREADLHESNLAQADLSKTDLRGANFAKTVLTGAELIKANLIGANFVEADLSGVDLEKAQVDRADLTSAKLEGAKLHQTNLGTAIGLTQSQVDAASGDSTTKLPAGLKRPAGWPKEEPIAKKDD